MTTNTTLDRRQLEGARGRLDTTQGGAGAGLPVVFLHADSGRASQWLDVQQEISAQRRTVAFDFCGHGQSAPARDGDYSFAGRFEDLLSVARSFELRHLIIAAHSGGAAVALEGAAAHSGMVAGMFLLDPPTDPRVVPPEMREGMLKGLAGPESLAFQKQFYATIAGANPAVRERVLTDCEATVPDARLGVAQALAGWDPEPSLHAWKGPIQIVSSKANANGPALFELRPDIPHRIVTDVGHWIQLDDPALVTSALQSFVEDLERAETTAARRLQG